MLRCEIHAVGVPATVAEPDVLRSRDGEMFRFSVPTTTNATAAYVMESPAAVPRSDSRCSSTAEPTAATVTMMSSLSAASSGGTRRPLLGRRFVISLHDPARFRCRGRHYRCEFRCRDGDETTVRVLYSESEDVTTATPREHSVFPYCSPDMTNLAM